jgi:hypothetical protein
MQLPKDSFYDAISDCRGIVFQESFALFRAALFQDQSLSIAAEFAKMPVDPAPARASPSSSRCSPGCVSLRKEKMPTCYLIEMTYVEASEGPASGM